MKKNRLYTMMAAAVLLTASCSDDLEKGGNGVDLPSTNGDRVYMTVNISTASTGSSTKANGEEGDGYLEELTGSKEAHVDDLNIFLVEYTSTDVTAYGTDYLKATNATAFQQKEIAGYGFKSGINQTANGGTEPNHDKVTVALLESVTPTEKQYLVYAIVNHGSAITTIPDADNDGKTTLADLLAYDYDSEVVSGSGAIANTNYSKFIMSTHKMTGQSGSSIVSISEDNKDESNPAVTTIYVERLAARIDLNVAAGLLSDDGYTPTSTTATNQGSFKLTRFIPINLYTGSSYMFKQVSPVVDSWDEALPAANTNYGTTDPYKYLGDEVWSPTSTVANKTGQYNYVLDPKITDKVITDGTPAITTYTNQFVSSFSPTTNAWYAASVLSSNTYTDGSTTFTPIVYTKENTLDLENQVNGYTTGMIFEVQFTPGENLTVSQYNVPDDKVDVVDYSSDDYTGNGTFLTAGHLTSDGSIQKVLYADVQTIGALAFDGLGTDKMTTQVYDGFMEGWTDNDTYNLASLKTIVNGMKESNSVELKFKEYLQGVLATENATFATIKSNLTWSAFIESESGSSLSLTGDVTDTYIGSLYEDWGISYYKEGKSYYKYWIRHDTNENVNVMSAMEFVIVRNNVYQLVVTGVRDLGDPLPYTPGKDSPDNPDESEEVFIDVYLYVKNWVKRTNSGIIL